MADIPLSHGGYRTLVYSCQTLLIMVPRTSSSPGSQMNSLGVGYFHDMNGGHNYHSYQVTQNNLFCCCLGEEEMILQF